MRKPVIDQNLTKKIKIDQIANVASRIKMQFTAKKDGEMITFSVYYNYVH